MADASGGDKAGPAGTAPHAQFAGANLPRPLAKIIWQGFESVDSKAWQPTLLKPHRGLA